MRDVVTLVEFSKKRKNNNLFSFAYNFKISRATLQWKSWLGYELKFYKILILLCNPHSKEKI